jgi:small GTP-binding protein
MKNVTLKCIIGGDGAVGKTSLVRAFMQDEFKKDYLLTVGVDVTSKSVDIGDNKVILSVNDIAGQPRFETFRSVFFKGAAIALLCFDLTRDQTLKSLTSAWVPELATQSDPNAPIHCVLVGNKSDLVDLRSISLEDAKAELKKMQKSFPNLKFIEYIETSAVERKNVNESFTILTSAFLKFRGML